MSNPEPVQTPAFRAHTKPRVGDEPLHRTPLPVKFSTAVYERLRAMKDRQGFIRHAVDRALAELDGKC